ncbi:hypothetical protein V8G54_024289 [Vigna mungo]|uniref:Protein transport protein SEC23 n=1 Tax=Vigna mungo TaxID=3915 RepID=A0AAQ3RSE4_VIGMU
MSTLSQRKSYAIQHLLNLISSNEKHTHVPTVLLGACNPKTRARIIALVGGPSTERPDLVGVAEIKVVVEKIGGLVVLSEIFGHSVFKDSFKRVFKDGEQSLGLCFKNGRNPHTKYFRMDHLPPCIDSSSTENSKGRSDVWGHFTKQETYSEKKAKCIYCGDLIKYLDGTSGTRNHLARCKENPNREAFQRQKLL